MMDYREYIDSLSDKQLKDLILGTETSAPIPIRGELVINRPQLIWAINKLRKENSLTINDKELNFEDCDAFAEKLIYRITRVRFNDFYIYDFLRFDLRKPGFTLFLIGLLFSLIGFVYFFYKVAQLIIFISIWI